VLFSREIGNKRQDIRSKTNYSLSELVGAYCKWLRTKTFKVLETLKVFLEKFVYSTNVEF
jgi:hypothetical protein